MPTQDVFRFTKITGISSPTAGTQTQHAHGLGTIPDITIFKNKSNGIIYESTDADATYIYIKGSAASLSFEAILLLGLS